MTSFLNDPGGGSVHTSSMTLTAPELVSLPTAGPQSHGLAEVLKVGIDPAALFGASYALRGIARSGAVNDKLKEWAGRPQEQAKTAPGQPSSAGNPAASSAGSAPATGNAASSAGAANPAMATQHGTAATSTASAGTAGSSTAGATPQAAPESVASSGSADVRAASPDSAGTTAAPAQQELSQDRAPNTGTAEPMDTSRQTAPPSGEGPDGGRGTPDHAPAAQPAPPDTATSRVQSAPPDGPDKASGAAGGTSSAGSASPPATNMSDSGPAAGAAAKPAENRPAVVAGDGADRSGVAAAKPAATTDVDGKARHAAASSAAKPAGGGDLDADKPRAARAGSATAKAPKPVPVTAGDLARESWEKTKAGLRKDGVKSAARIAGRQAVSNGARITSKLAASMMLRLGAMSVPGLGAALMAATWFFDPEVRTLWSKIWMNAQFWNDAIAAPALDAAPEPPRTHYLPLTHDGNRDHVIDNLDKAMVETMDTSFRFPAAQVWPPNEGVAAAHGSQLIETTTEGAGTITEFNELATALGEAAAAAEAAYKAGASEPYVMQAWAKTEPGVAALRKYHEEVLPAMGSTFIDGIKAGNSAYQSFREVNIANRQAINKSSSGLVGFLFPRIDVGDTRDAAAVMRTAATNMDVIVTKLADAPNVVTVAPNRDVDGTLVGNPETKPDEPPQNQAPPLPLAPAAPLAPTPAPGTDAKPAQAKQDLKDLASMLADKIPPMPNPASMMPQIPGMGSGIPDLGSLIPSSPAADSLGLNKDTGLTEDDIAKRLDELKNAPKDNFGPEAAPEATPGIAPVTPPAAAAPVTTPTPEAPAPTPEAAPAASNTADIAGQKIQFDNPKHAAMAQALHDGAGATSLFTAASDAGLQVPPPGQDIGEPVDDLKKGDVVIGADDRGVFIGDIDDKPMVVTESGEVKPLADITATFNGVDHGIFRLADNGSPLPQLPQPSDPVIPAAQQSPTSPTSLTAEQTDPGVIPGQQTGTTGLNPGVVPPQP